MRFAHAWHHPRCAGPPEAGFIHRGADLRQVPQRVHSHEVALDFEGAERLLLERVTAPLQLRLRLTHRAARLEEPAEVYFIVVPEAGVLVVETQPRARGSSPPDRGSVDRMAARIRARTPGPRAAERADG